MPRSVLFLAIFLPFAILLSHTGIFYAQKHLIAPGRAQFSEASIGSPEDAPLPVATEAVATEGAPLPVVTVTFVIPTRGRATLSRALSSLRNQTDRGWQAVVINDAVRSWHLPRVDDVDERILAIELGRRVGESNSEGHDHGAEVRNVALRSLTSDWAAFLDDDDIVSPHYVKYLKESIVHSPDVDLIVFRMRFGALLVPEPNTACLKVNHVGISFAVRREFISTQALFFKPSEHEDFTFLMEAKLHGANILIAPYVAYYVRAERTPPSDEVYDWVLQPVVDADEFYNTLRGPPASSSGNSVTFSAVMFVLLVAVVLIIKMEHARMSTATKTTRVVRV